MLEPGRPHLLAVDDVEVTLPSRRRPDARGVTASNGLRHRKRLEPQLACRDARQEHLALLLAAKTKHRRHGVELGVDRRSVAAAPVDLLEDDRGVAEAEPEAAVLLRNESAEQAGTRQRGDELLGVGLLSLELTPVRIAEVGHDPVDELPELTPGRAVRRHGGHHCSGQRSSAPYPGPQPRL